MLDIPTECVEVWRVGVLVADPVVLRDGGIPELGGVVLPGGAGLLLGLLLLQPGQLSPGRVRQQFGQVGLDRLELKQFYGISIR